MIRMEKCLKRGIKKLRNTRGESLAETMAAFLIATLGLTMLPGAIVTAARVNRAAEQQYVRAERLNPVAETGTSPSTVSLFPGGDTADVLDVTVYRDDPGSNQAGDSYYFYEVNTTAGAEP